MNFKKLKNIKGEFGNYFILWLLGIPLPILLLVSLLRGCR